MASKVVVEQGIKQVKPILSIDKADARRRVISLYKAWYRQIPQIVNLYNVPYDLRKVQAKLKENFVKNKHLQDIRAIDMLCVKGQMDLNEALEGHKQINHVMQYFQDTVEPPPKDFLGKFFAGQE